LQYELRKYWILSDEEQFWFIGLDWLLVLLSSVDAEVKAEIVLLLWRVWYLHNDMLHGKRMTTIIGSMKFLISYGILLQLASHALPARTTKKRKGKVFKCKRQV
jgi:hypothetical protein